MQKKKAIAKFNPSKVSDYTLHDKCLSLNGKQLNPPPPHSWQVVQKKRDTVTTTSPGNTTCGGSGGGGGGGMQGLK